MTNFYVYVHTRNDTGEVFYVGKGSGRRAFVRGRTERSQYWTRIAAKHGFTALILERFQNEDDAFCMERYLIASYNALCKSLVNHTLGGEGTSGPCSEEKRLKLLGKKRSAESIQRMRDAQLAVRANENSRRQHTAETKAKMAASANKRFSNPLEKLKLTGPKSAESIEKFKLTWAKKRAEATRRG